MSNVHRIRLSGGWVASPLPDGGLQHTRGFGSPRTLDPSEAVFLTCDRLTAPAAVTVNGTPFGPFAGAFAIDITALMQKRNLVCVEGDQPPGEVAIEFRGR